LFSGKSGPSDLLKAVDGKEDLKENREGSGLLEETVTLPAQSMELS
jgi:hypothetical protein